MRTIILASAAALLLSGSLANAQFLLGEDSNGHKQVTNLYAGQVIAEQRDAPRRFAAPIPRSRVATATTTAGRVSPGFLLGMGGGDHKRVTNQYSGHSWPR
jgi:hypothetical protein